LLTANPILCTMEPDVAALPANRLGVFFPAIRRKSTSCCRLMNVYRLVGLKFRTHWRGLSGQTEVGRELSEFFRRDPQTSVRSGGQRGCAVMNLAIVDKIVNALLYEGYILYPYRASTMKKPASLQFWASSIQGCTQRRNPAPTRGTMQTHCLAVDAGSASIEICVRFLRIVDRVVGVREES